MTDITNSLRAICGHDSRSVDGCIHCEAADEIERLRALSAPAPAAQARCQNCDDTGDVHSIDGQWRGICHCQAGQALRDTRAAPAAQAEPVALDYMALIDAATLRKLKPGTGACIAFKHGAEWAHARYATPAAPSVPAGWPTAAMIDAANRTCRNDERCEHQWTPSKCRQCREEAADDLRAAIAAAPAAPSVPHAWPLAEWDEEDGAVLWWRFPVDEPPYIGNPLCDDWPGYHTHWTRISIPAAPQPGAPTPEDER